MGKLPALHLRAEKRLLSADQIRPWLDSTYPLGAHPKELQGMPDQSSFDRALAIAQLILTIVYPAYLASLPTPRSDLYLRFAYPPPLAAGLTTPLPAALTGEIRDIDEEEILSRGAEALEALSGILAGSDKWALGAIAPTPLDALIASHLHVILALPTSSPLRAKLDQTDLTVYLDRVMSFAEARMP